jgi:citronellol/citronellal dehydrogenase
VNLQGKSLFITGMAEEFRTDGIAFNTLWPRTTIATAAVEFALGGRAMMERSRKPEIMADAAHAIFCRPARDFTGRFLIDDELLYAEGVRGFEQYSVTPGTALQPDIFIDPKAPTPQGLKLDS